MLHIGVGAVPPPWTPRIDLAEAHRRLGDVEAAMPPLVWALEENETYEVE